jgi:leucyl aminopeptidase
MLVVHATAFQLCAEGRLVLGDGVAYAAKILCEGTGNGVIVDMATLTGAQGIATGKRFSALYCSDAELEASGAYTDTSMICYIPCFDVSV